MSWDNRAQQMQGYQQQQQQQQMMNAYQPQSNGAGVGGVQEARTLWMGDLEPWMEENYLKQLWYSLGEVINVKMIKDKMTQASAGYCFIEFTTSTSAAKLLASLNGTVIPGTRSVFKLNWAAGSGYGNENGTRSGGENNYEFSIFVGDLGQEVTDTMLMQFFQARYPSTKGAKVVADPQSLASKGYGFVRFGEESEQKAAMTEMNGQNIGSRQVRISVATPKSKMMQQQQMGGHMGHMGYGQQYGQQMQHHYNQGYHQQQQQPDQNSTTVFVGGIPAHIGEDELRGVFQPIGDIVSIKVPPNKGCGFIQFAYRGHAEMAIQQMNGCTIGGNRVRLNWGRLQNTDKQAGGAAAQGAQPYSVQQPQMYSYTGSI